MKEKNIRELAKRMGLITVEDMCQYTIAHLVVKIANKVNELIGEVGRFETDVQETLKTQNENIQYLLGEGLHLEVGNIFDGWVQDGTFDTLINQTALKKVNNRIDETNAQLSQIKKDINSLLYYPRLDGEIDDQNRFLRAIDGTSTGGKLLIPSGTYQLNDYITLTKSIEIQGDGMFSTLINGGGIKIESSNITINDLSVNCPQKANAFQANQTKVSNIRINRCRGIARDHSFLFESYYGTVQNVIVQDCISDASIHGFISKAYDVKFINCKANNHTSGFAFGMISDNIPGVDNVANAFFNMIENCSAYNCGSGVRSYCRDKWEQTCVPRCYNNRVNGFIALDCVNPISIGEETTPNDYQSIYRIEYTTVTGVQDFGTKQGVYSVNLANTYRCILDNCTLIYDVRQSENVVDNVIGNIVTKNVVNPNTSTISINSPKSYEVNTSLNSSIELYLQGESSDSSVVKFVGSPKNGNIITVLVRNAGRDTFGGFDTTNTIVDTSQHNILKTGITFNHGQVTQWMWIRGLNKWMCIYASNLINLA